jgi:hypothetical protein
VGSNPTSGTSGLIEGANNGSFALMAVVLVAVPVVLAAPALAQYREFSGKVDKITKTKIFVDNRMGDKVSFAKVDDTVVEGEKTDWDKIQKNDWVTISWKFVDKPRRAYKVVVKPAPEEAGEDM